MAHNNLGVELRQRASLTRRLDSTSRHCKLSPITRGAQHLGRRCARWASSTRRLDTNEQALRIKPDYFSPTTTGKCAGAEGQVDEAIGQYQQALQINPIRPKRISPRNRSGRVDRVQMQCTV